MQSQMPRFLTVLVILYCAAFAAAALPDPLSPDTFARWQPMPGSPPAATSQVQGRRALRMDCKFAGTTLGRASWDILTPLDLSGASAIRFRVLCPNTAPISSCTIYLRSGHGWYAAPFLPENDGDWCDIEIRPENTRIEGKPSGWGLIDCIRISAWRGENKDATLYLADFTVVTPRCPVVVLRGDSIAKSQPDERQPISEYTQRTTQLLREAGIDCAVRGDLECTPETLRNAKLVVLPYNPRLPAAATEALTAYLHRGGKLLSFYIVPEELWEPCGIAAATYRRETRHGEFARMRPDKEAIPGAPDEVKQASWNVMDYRPIEKRGRAAAWWLDADGKAGNVAAIVRTDFAVCVSHVLIAGDEAAKRELLFAMSTAAAPEVGREAVQQTLVTAGKIVGDESFPPIGPALAPLGEASKAALGRAAQLRAQAQQMLDANQFPQAMRLVRQSHDSLLEAYFSAQRPAAGEHRAFWCHSAFGVPGMSWDQAIQRLSQNGFTAIFPNMLWGGSAFYQSDVLPVSPEVASRGDQLAQCLAACRKYGLQCHVWKVNWNMGWSASDEFLRKMKAAGRTQVAFDGSDEDHWLCPSNPENQALEIAAMFEVASKYDVDGIHFDYIRYPDVDHCFCKGCRQRFEERIGNPVANWPADVRRDPQLASAWQEFREASITRVVAEVRRKIREAGRKTQISAAVFANYANDRNIVAQDWRLWCRQGYLDFVCPMDYTPSNREFRNMVARQLEYAGNVPIYPGIGISTWPGAQRDVAKLIQQIRITRELGCKGFTVFEYNLPECTNVVPACAKGITAPQ